MIILDKGILLEQGNKVKLHTFPAVYADLISK